MSGFAYSVAIRLSVANLASQGVRLLAKDLLAAHGNAVKLQDKLKALKMIAVGYGVEKAGQGILGFLDKAVDASKEYTHQLALMNAAGFTHREIAQSIGSAWQATSKVITSTAAGNLETLRELRTAFGAGEGMQHAYAMLPTVQRASAIMQSLTGKQQSNVGFDMVKAIEFGTKGALTVSEMSKQSEMMTKALVAFNGTLTVSDFHQTLKASKLAAAYLSDDFKYTVLPTIMQEMKSGHGGAQAAGTAIATLFGTIKGHAIMRRQMQAWEDSGLVSANMVKRDPHHAGSDKIMPGGVAGENLFTQNPEAWAVKYLIPARDKLMAKYHMDEAGAYYALTGNRNTAFMFSTLANKGAQFARDQDLINRVGSSYGAYQKLLKSDPELASQAMHSQWQNLLAIIGYQILPKMIPFMQMFANGLNTISTWMAAHPIASSSLVIGIGVLGGAMDLAGKVMMGYGMLRLVGLAGTLTSIATGASVAAPAVGILGGLLSGPFVAGLAAAALAVGGIVLAAKLIGSGSSVPKGQDVNAMISGAGRGSHVANALHWVLDGSNRTGMNGHWEGVGSGRMNGGRGPHGERVSTDYAYVAPMAVHVTTNLNVDGVKLAHHQHKHHAKIMNKEMSRPNTGTTGYDSSRSMPQVAGR